MLPVLLTALGVGGATVIGALIGFIFKKIPHKMNDVLLAFAGGIMLAAATFGLILPSIEMGGDFGLLFAVTGIFAGALFLNVIDRIVPHLHRLIDASEKSSCSPNSKNLNRVLLFVIAIGIHNLPEGIAAGVGFGAGEIGDALVIALGIALQNIPEGMIIIAPLLAAGVSAGKTFALAAATGVIEVLGTFLGYFAVSFSTAVLPFALAFAGGTMLYVISDEMIPETHAHGAERSATYSLLFGFCLMLTLDFFLG